MSEFIDLTKVLKVGGKAWSAASNNMAVTNLVNVKPYVISYTKDGKRHVRDKYPTLFPDDQKPNFTYEPESEIDFSKLPKGVKCIVSSNDFLNTDVRYFSDYLPLVDSKFLCYSKGDVGKKARTVTAWLYCKLHPSVKVKKEWLK